MSRVRSSGNDKVQRFKSNSCSVCSLKRDLCIRNIPSTIVQYFVTKVELSWEMMRKPIDLKERWIGYIERERNVPRNSQFLRVLSSTPVTVAIWSSKCETIWLFLRLNCVNMRRALWERVFTLLRVFEWSFDFCGDAASRNAF